jgi:chemotaxis response regulator CheB
VVLADADVTLGETVEAILDGYPGIALVGCALDGERAVQLAYSLAPDVVFVATDMPGGIEAAQHMLHLMPKPPKVILMAPEEPPAADADVTGYGLGLPGAADVSGYAGLAAAADISGYLRKTADAAELVGLLAALAALAMAPRDLTNGHSG